MGHKKTGLIVGLALLAPGAIASSDQIGPSSTVVYDIHRHGDNIGEHRVHYETVDNGETSVEVKARMRVKLMFMTVFKLDHHSTEIWDNGELNSINSVTERQGRTETVTVEAQDDCLHLVRKTETQKEEATLPLDVLPSSFTPKYIWSEEPEQEFLVLDTLSGERREVTLAYQGETALTLDNGQLIDTHYYRLIENKDGRLSQEFWLDDSDQLLRIMLHTTAGDEIDYRLAVG